MCDVCEKQEVSDGRAGYESPQSTESNRRAHPSAGRTGSEKVAAWPAVSTHELKGLGPK